MSADDSIDGTVGKGRRRWTRAASTELVEKYERAVAAEQVGQREFARQHDVPLGTLQHWLARKAGLDADPAVVALLESPTGLAFLHRLVVAATFQFCQVGPCGVDHVSAFLRLARLDVFVATAHAVMHGLGGEMEQGIVDFGAFQRAALAAGMQPRPIVVAADETFHPEVCLVAIEPASNFILLEEYAPNREAATWTAAMEAALTDLPVTVVAAASDEGSGLIRHIKHGLGVTQAPDILHAQRELFKALSQLLALSLKAPQKALEEASESVISGCRRQAAYLTNPRVPARPPLFAKHIAAARERAQAARRVYAAAVDRYDRTGAAIRALSRAYHPVDLLTGAVRNAAQVEADLACAMATVDATAEALKLPAARRRRNMHPDCSTAAERFFGSPHDALFEWLLDHLDVPARPRSRPQRRAA